MGAQPTDAIAAAGVLLLIGDGADPETFTSLPGLVSLTPFGLSRNEIDATSHNKAQAKNLLGILRAGQVNFTINWDPRNAVHGAGNSTDTDTIFALIINNDWRNYQIPLPADGPVIGFYAGVQNLQPAEMQVDGLMQMSGALTIDLETLDVTEPAT